MSLYFIKRRGWRYDFTLQGIRYTEAGFKSKREAKRAEAKRREEILDPSPKPEKKKTDMDFLALVNKRLDYVKEYNSERYYSDHIYLARRWVKQWGKLKCSQVNMDKIQAFLLKRKRQTSGYTANKELRAIRALFNFAMKPGRQWISLNPTSGIEFFPVEKRLKYVPPKEDVLRVLMAADADTRDYLWTIALTLGRMSEINRLTWQDVDLKQRFVVLYTRKKRGGHLTPRKIPMNDRLYSVLSRRHTYRDKYKPWVFWHRYKSHKLGKWVEGPFFHRKRSMRSLCDKAGVKAFGFHALRHYGASILEQSGVPIGSIQRILGHESRLTTEIYLHSIGESERSAMEVLDVGFENNFSHESHTKKKGATA